MKNFHFFISFILIVSIVTKHVHTSPTYWELRKHFLKLERDSYIGANITLNNAKEQFANECLMKKKHHEIDTGFKNPNEFLPAQNFISVRKKIEESEVFQIIRKMPKGAVLHVHDLGLTSANFVFYNITYRQNLYICKNGNEIKMMFLKQPAKDCDWLLLSELRKNSSIVKHLNRLIFKEITMFNKKPDKAYPNIDLAWKKFQKIFKNLRPLLTYKPVFEDFIYQGLQELYDDNVMYVEMRSVLFPLYDLNGAVYDHIETMKTLQKISQRFKKDHVDFLGMKLIYAPSRMMNNTTFSDCITLVKQLRKLFPNFMIGFDLVGQEDKGQPLSSFADELLTLNGSVPFFFHSGETNWNGMSTDLNLIDAVLLNTTRIGHGYAVLKHPAVLQKLKENSIAIEINPISNQVLKLVGDLRNHPASFLFAENYPVVISCDDPGLWDAVGLSYDFYETFIGIMSNEADLKALKQLVINSIMFSALGKAEKKHAMHLLNIKWINFIKQVNAENCRKYNN